MTTPDLYADYRQELIDTLLQSLGIPSHVADPERYGHWPAALEAAPEDFALRGIYADWLADRGRAEEADGWRALYRLKRRPLYSKASESYYWERMTGRMFCKHFHAPFVRSSGRTGGDYGRKHPVKLPDVWAQQTRLSQTATTWDHWYLRDQSLFSLERAAALAWGRMGATEREPLVALFFEGVS